jgi:hypothetical protein
VAEERPAPGTLLDYLLYAPLGAAVVAAEELPRLAERGRERFEKRIVLASSIGKFAVAAAVRRLKAPPSGHTSVLVAESQPAPQAPSPVPVAPPPSTQRRAPQATRPSRPPRPRSPAVGKSAETAELAADVAGEELPIPAYGTMAASQVVERLASLTPSELESVRRHESATRRRRTVLHRIAQLNAERGGVTA